jgi:hypothetical protein
VLFDPATLAFMRAGFEQPGSEGELLRKLTTGPSRRGRTRRPSCGSGRWPRAPGRTPWAIVRGPVGAEHRLEPRRGASQ